MGTINLYLVTNNSKLATLTIDNTDGRADIAVFINTTIDKVNRVSGMIDIDSETTKEILLHIGDEVILCSKGTGLNIMSTSGISNLQEYDPYTDIFTISEPVAIVKTAITGSGGSTD